MQEAELIALISVVIAAAVAVWANMIARGAREEARKANSSAERAADAAERSAAAEEGAVALAEAQESGPPWEFVYNSDGVFELVNTSNDRVYGVTLTLPPRAIGDGIPKPVDIDGKSGHTFRAAFSMGASRVVDVRWHRQPDRNDESRSWKRALPPRTRKR